MAYARAVAQSAGLSAKHSDLIGRTVRLHDVGKIGIPDRILLKPDRLTDEEMAVVRRHPQIGADLLAGEDSEPIRTARVIALTHHERWDGTGYPAGLPGEEIPLEGRICALADVFDALTTSRSYKSAWNIDRAVELIEDHSATHFDPGLVVAFRTALPEIERIHAAYPEKEREQGRDGNDG